jgi:DNA-binding NtrC family response regulator
VEHFLKKFSAKFHKENLSVSTDVERQFIDHLWPGNVRELKHALERACILCHRETITADLLPSLSQLEKAAPPSPEEKIEINAEAILRALDKSAWNKAKAARQLGVDRKTLYRYLDKFSISKQIPD